MCRLSPRDPPSVYLTCWPLPTPCAPHACWPRTSVLRSVQLLAAASTPAPCAHAARTCWPLPRAPRPPASPPRPWPVRTLAPGGGSPLHVVSCQPCRVCPCPPCQAPVCAARQRAPREMEKWICEWCVFACLPGAGELARKRWDGKAPIGPMSDFFTGHRTHGF